MASFHNVGRYYTGWWGENTSTALPGAGLSVLQDQPARQDVPSGPIVSDTAVMG